MPRLTNSACDEVAGERDALRLRHLAWQGELDLAGKLRVLADLEGFDIVPQPLAVAPRLGRLLRQQHLGMHNTALGRRSPGCDRCAHRRGADEAER